MQAVQGKRRNKENTSSRPFTIALHINVTVRQIFSDGPADPLLASKTRFGGVPFFVRRLQDLARQYS